MVKGLLQPVEPLDEGPGFLRVVGVVEEAQAAGRNRAFFDQCLDVDQLLPEGGAKQHDGHGLGLAGLYQREHFKQFVQRAKAAGEGDQGLGAHHEVHFAQREVVELEGQRWRDVRVAVLLMGQGDVQAHVQSRPRRVRHGWPLP